MYHRLYLVHMAITTGRPESLAGCIGGVTEHQYQTRASSQRALSRIRTEQGRRRLSYSGVEQYNRLSFDAITCGFKSRLRRHLLRVQHGTVPTAGRAEFLGYRRARFQSGKKLGLDHGLSFKLLAAYRPCDNEVYGHSRRVNARQTHHAKKYSCNHRARPCYICYNILYLGVRHV